MGTGPNSKGADDYINSRCVVTFRPLPGWNGEYGFDWLRDGDFEEFDGKNGTRPVKYNYKDIIGQYDERGNFQKKFGPRENPQTFEWRYADEHFQYLDIKKSAKSKSVKRYCIPYLLIKEKEKVVLSLNIKTEGNDVTDLMFVSKKCKIFIGEEDITKKLIPISKIMSIKQISVEIENTIRDGDEQENRYISVHAFYFNNSNNKKEHALSGRIILVGNRQYKVIFHYFNVILESSQGKSNQAEKSDFDPNFVNGIFSQAGITIEGEPDSVSLSITRAQIQSFLSRGKKGEADLTNFFHEKIQKNIQKKKIEPILPRIIVLFIPFLHQVVASNDSHLFSNKTEYNITGGWMIFHNKNEKNKEWTNYYDKNNCDWKYIVVFNPPDQKGSEYVSIALSHELLHSLGLLHSFDIIPPPRTKTLNDNRRNKLSFEKNMTNNIMDYSGYGKILWQWQWNIIRKNCADELSKRLKETYLAKRRAEESRKKRLKEAYLAKQKGNSN